MTSFQIEVRAKQEQYDVQAQRLTREILFLPQLELHTAGTNSPPAPGRPQGSPLHLAEDGRPTGNGPGNLLFHTAQLFRLTGNLSPTDIDLLTTDLLIDPVIQEARFSEDAASSATHIVDVFFLPGVTDTLAASVIVGARMLGITRIEQAATGCRYQLDSRLSEAEVRTIAEALLYNPVIQRYVLHLVGTSSSRGNDDQFIDPKFVPTSLSTSREEGARNWVPTAGALSDMSDQELLDVSKRGLLALNLDEMRTIQHHYRELGREPTDVELETLAQTWSEHCSHKTFKAMIAYRELDSEGRVLDQEHIPGLLKHYLMRATEQVKQPWLVSAFSDNAGIIRFTETQDIAFKVETHNHPSAIEPFGGANTGVGGVIRDVLGVSAQPLACTDVLCFGPLDTPTTELPRGILPPRRIASGVVNGVRDYGNKMGIPTVNGAVLYNEGYIYNPLVFCGCLGILPHGSHPRQVQPGDRIVVLGGRTGRDGIHGATFSSGEMSSEINAQAGSAVQIGAPITEKKVADVLVQARDRRLYSAITDCGAGGFSSAIGEMALETGAYVELEKAPLKYAGLAPWEIWLSEAQERMVLAVPPEHLEELLELCEIEEVEASVIGIFTDDARLTVSYQEQIVADIDMAFLHEGRPRRKLEAVWTRKSRQWDAAHVAHSLTYTRDDWGKTHYAPTLLALLRHPDIASKEEIVRRYDFEVQGATVRKPLVGSSGSGPGDAAVLQPLLAEASRAGIVLSNGINPLYGSFDPYHMATNAVDEALRNLTAVGGNIERAAILDNFCWGNPSDPEQLGMLVRAVKGCCDAALGFGVPFISGKDSLNNEYRAAEQRLPVLPTLLISAVGVIDDVFQTVDMSLKAPGNLLYLIGTTKEEMGGSHYAEVVGHEMFEQFFPYASVPQVDIAYAFLTMKALGAAIRDGLVCSCHDLSEGGLAVALAEMVIASSLGVRVNLRGPLLGDSNRRVGNIVRLFSESASRFVVEVALDKWEAFEQYMQSKGVHDVKHIGTVTAAGYLHIYEHDELIYLSLAELQAAWKGGQA